MPQIWLQCWHNPPGCAILFYDVFTTFCDQISPDLGERLRTATDEIPQQEAQFTMTTPPTIRLYSDIH